jgi:hypothetical protein
VNILRVASCRLCGKAILFSDDQVSELTGKKIPLDETGEPHNCTKQKTNTEAIILAETAARRFILMAITNQRTTSLSR